MYPTSPMHYWAEHVKKCFVSWKHHKSSPHGHACWLLPKKKKLLVLPVSNMKVQRNVSSCTSEDPAPYMDILTGMKKFWLLLSFFFYYVAFQKVQWGTVQHKAIFLVTINLFFTGLCFFGQWNGKHTHKHTSITVFTCCSVQLTFNKQPKYGL